MRHDVVQAAKVFNELCEIPLSPRTHLLFLVELKIRARLRSGHNNATP